MATNKDFHIRLLEAREIECRISQIQKQGKGLSLLLYKDARVDMAILDETFGPMNWQRHHTRDNANCIISVWDGEKGCWVDKEDVGTESNTEAVKGLASDSFKRAGFNWGIGRELYTAPFIWIDKANCDIKEENGRFRCYDAFEVKEIGYNEHREINRLVIINSKTKAVVWEFGKPSKAVERPSKAPQDAPKGAPAEPAKAAEMPNSEATGKAPFGTTATEEQKQYIRDNASDDDYMEIMQEYGAELENLTYNDAVQEIKRIDNNNSDQHPRCTRCSKVVTGTVLPDGTTMTASEIIGKSKITYGAIYCAECCKALKKQKNKNKDKAV